MDQECLIALGANLPVNSQSTIETCQKAVVRLAAGGLKLRRLSRFFTTPAFPAGTGPDYINAALAGGWAGGADTLLALLHSVEGEFERERIKRWGARTLDLDLVTLGHLVRPNPTVLTDWIRLPLDDQTNRTPTELILPHPRLQDRGFVLVPLNDIAPEWRHPVLGRTIAQMTAALPAAQRAEVRPL